MKATRIALVAMFAVGTTIAVLAVRRLMPNDGGHIASVGSKLERSDARSTYESEKSLEPGRRRNSAVSPEVIENSDRQTFTTATSPLVNPAHGSASSTKIPSATSIDESVIGIPFPISDSVREVVELHAKDMEYDRGVIEPLARFSGEPRDDEWASAIERELRDVVRRSNGAFSIRNVECRRTICAWEVESAPWEHPRWLPHDVQSRLNVVSGDALAATERRPNGSKVAVTLQIYDRYTHVNASSKDIGVEREKSR